MKLAIITGITGQDGAYLSKLLLEKGYTVVGVVRGGSLDSLDKLLYLGIQDKITFEECNLLDYSAIVKLLHKYQPDEIYNLAAQSSVQVSFEQPIDTIQFNIISVLNLLEAIKKENRNIKLYQASSSEMFGKVERLPVAETTAFHPLSPYAVSKASAHWIVINYREAYNLFVCSGILFNHESYLRQDNFFVKKIIRESLRIKRGQQEFIKVGNIDIKRDFGYAPAYVEAIWLMMQQETPADFIICSGKSISLREIIHYVFKKLGISEDKLVISQELYRPTDIEDIYGDNSSARKLLGWEYNTEFTDILDILIDEEERNTNGYDSFNHNGLQECAGHN